MQVSSTAAADLYRKAVGKASTGRSSTRSRSRTTTGLATSMISCASIAYVCQKSKNSPPNAGYPRPDFRAERGPALSAGGFAA
jgi:hypothetical protein